MSEYQEEEHHPKVAHRRDGEVASMYIFELDGHSYQISGPTISDEEAETWFALYASRVPRCAADDCGRLFTPGEVALMNGDTHYHTYDGPDGESLRCVAFDDSGTAIPRDEQR